MRWTRFNDWLADDLRLLEVSGEFPRSDYNTMFDQQLDQLINQMDSPHMRNQLRHGVGVDWVGYIAKSLRNAGFRDHDIDPLTQEIVIRLLIKPGNLFKGWSGQPIGPRFKRSVRNAIINMVEKRQVRRKYIPSMSISANPGMALPSTQPMNASTIDAFREFLRMHLGQLAVDVLDERLAGGETKSLAGRPGLETIYKVKQMVRDVKLAAKQFAVSEPSFLAMVERAMGNEKETVAVSWK